MDVKIQVEFNPRQVAECRWVGYLVRLANSVPALPSLEAASADCVQCDGANFSTMCLGVLAGLHFTGGGGGVPGGGGGMV